MSRDSIDTYEQSRNVYWMNDFKILYIDDNYIRFFPTKNMTRIEQLNALARFSIYLFIIFIIMDRKDEWLFVPIILIIMNIVLYNLLEIDDDGKKKDFTRLHNMTKDTFLRDTDHPIDRIKNKNHKVSIGYYDSNGDLVFSSSDRQDRMNDQHDKINDRLDRMNDRLDRHYSLDEYREFVKNMCMPPTENNPMMNQNVSHMNQDNLPIRCDPDDILVEQKVVEAFNKNLIRDANDLLDTKNSQRQFMPLNNIIPNDQEAFSKWCYGDPDACKVNPLLCVRNNDMLGMYNSC